MNCFRTLMVSLFCAIVISSNAQDKDCFADFNKELSNILKKESKSSRMPRKVVKWNRKKICRQFNMILANMHPDDFVSSDTIIVVRKSQEYICLGEDKAFFAVKCLPNQRHYRFMMINTAKKDTIITILR